MRDIGVCLDSWFLKAASLGPSSTAHFLTLFASPVPKMTDNPTPASAGIENHPTGAAREIQSGTWDTAPQTYNVRPDNSEQTCLENWGGQGRTCD
jgi:hypothetical protein